MTISISCKGTTGSQGDNGERRAEALGRNCTNSPQTETAARKTSSRLHWAVRTQRSGLDRRTSPEGDGNRVVDTVHWLCSHVLPNTQVRSDEHNRKEDAKFSRQSRQRACTLGKTQRLLVSSLSFGSFQFVKRFAPSSHDRSNTIWHSYQVQKSTPANPTAQKSGRANTEMDIFVSALLR